MKLFKRPMSLKADKGLEDIFYIVKGQYLQQLPKAQIGEEEKFIGGYDPENKNTIDWYRVLDNRTFFTLCAGPSLESCLKTLTRTVKKVKTVEGYYKYLSTYTTEDYYQTHFLGREGMSSKEAAERASSEGKQMRTGAVQKAYERAVFNAYGDYFEEEVKEAVRKGLEEADRPKKLVKRVKRLSLD